MLFLANVVTVLAATSYVSGSQVPFIQIPERGRDAGNGRADTKRVLTLEFNKFIEEVLANGTIPGLTLGVVHPSGGVELGAYGRKTEDGDKMTTDTLFDLASCSKAFLASSVGILMNDFAHGRNSTPLPPGVTRFDWYSKVADILPDEWKLIDNWAASNAMFRDILSHQSGLPRHDLSYTPTDTLSDVVHRMRYLRPAFELRQRYHYNNQMYILGAYVISKYTGMPYMKFVKERIFDPLNMTSTTFLESEASKDGKLTQTWTIGDRRIPFWFPDEYAELSSGPGGIISSVVDMVKWIKMLIDGGVNPVTNTTVIPKSVFDMTTIAHTVVTGRAKYPELSTTGYAMGWSRFSYQGHEIITHSGGIPGFSTEVFFLPWDNLGIVTLANADAKHVYELGVIYRIIEDYFGLKRTHSSRMLDVATKKSQVSPKQDAHAKDNFSRAVPPLPLEAYAGTYVDPGYPNITLCAPTSNSLDCRFALEQFAHFENITTSQSLYAIVPSMWVSHARVRHKEGNAFALSGTYLFPHGYGRDISPFETWEEGIADATAEFAVEESADGEAKVIGVGLRGLVGETTNRERVGGAIREIAEVYWVKF